MSNSSLATIGSERFLLMESSKLCRATVVTTTVMMEILTFLAVVIRTELDSELDSNLIPLFINKSNM